MSQAPKNGKKGIDAWTNNGYGLSAKPAITKAQAEKINKAVEERQRKKK